VYLEINVTVLSNNFLEYFLEIEKLFIHSEVGYVRCSSLVFPTNAWPQLKSRQLGFCLQRKHEDSWIVVSWIVDNWIVDEEAFHKKRKWLCQAVLCNGLN
jgi:hypothetical protein